MAIAGEKGNSAPGVTLEGAILTVLPQGVLTYSVGGECKSANEAAANLLGIPRERMLRQNFREIPVWKNSSLLDLAEETMRTGSPRRMEMPYLPDPDASRWLDLKLTCVSMHGEAHLLVILEDVTEHKRAEEALRDAMTKLEHSNWDLEQFARVVSHDLQEPLRMVESYTQLLAQRYENHLDDKAQKYIYYAVDGAVRMQRLINDLLTYSRVATQSHVTEPIDSGLVLGEALRNLSAVIEESGATVSSGHMPQVRADATQLLQVFQNLIANAIKFHGEDSPEVHVSGREEDGEWLFSVKDNGIGIDTQYADRVYTIFQRLHTRDEYPGTGVGLAVCKRIVQRHGGRIWFESEIGKGSTFFFTLVK